MNTWRPICNWNITRVTRFNKTMRWQLSMPCAFAMKRTTLTCLCVLLLSGCASRASESVPTLQIDGMLIENKSQMWVSSVRVLVPATGNFVACSTINPRSKCSTTFPETAYTGNPVLITWRQGGSDYSSGEFVIQLPAGVDYERPARVLVVITGPGAAGAVITQN